MIISNSRDSELHYKGRNEPIMVRGELKEIQRIADILGKNRLRNLRFDILKGKMTAQEAIMLNRVEEELPSASEVRTNP